MVSEWLSITRTRPAGTLHQHLHPIRASWSWTSPPPHGRRVQIWCDAAGNPLEVDVDVSDLTPPAALANGSGPHGELEFTAIAVPRVTTPTMESMTLAVLLAVLLAECAYAWCVSGTRVGRARRRPATHTGRVVSSKLIGGRLALPRELSRGAESAGGGLSVRTVSERRDWTV